MINLEYDILSTLHDKHGMQYNELISKFPEHLNDVHDVLVTLYDDGLVLSTENIKETRKGFIRLAPKGVIALYAEKEYQDFKRATELSSRKQFKITQLIALISTIAVIADVIVSILAL